MDSNINDLKKKVKEIERQALSNLEKARSCGTVPQKSTRNLSRVGPRPENSDCDECVEQLPCETGCTEMDVEGIIQLSDCYGNSIISWENSCTADNGRDNVVVGVGADVGFSQLKLDYECVEGECTGDGDDDRDDGGKCNVVVGRCAESHVSNSIVLGCHAKTRDEDCNGGDGQLVLGSKCAKLQCTLDNAKCEDVDLCNPPLFGENKCLEGYEVFVDGSTGPVHSLTGTLCSHGDGVVLSTDEQTEPFPFEYPKFYKGLRVIKNGVNFLRTVGSEGCPTGDYFTYIPIVLQEAPPPVKVDIKLYEFESNGEAYQCQEKFGYIYPEDYPVKIPTIDTDGPPIEVIYGTETFCATGYNANWTGSDCPIFTVSPSETHGCPTGCYLPGQQIIITLSQNNDFMSPVSGPQYTVRGPLLQDGLNPLPPLNCDYTSDVNECMEWNLTGKCGEWTYTHTVGDCDETLCFFKVKCIKFRNLLCSIPSYLPFFENQEYINLNVAPGAPNSNTDDAIEITPNKSLGCCKERHYIQGEKINIRNIFPGPKFSFGWFLHDGKLPPSAGETRKRFNDAGNSLVPEVLLDFDGERQWISYDENEGEYQLCIPKDYYSEGCFLRFAHDNRACRSVEFIIENQNNSGPSDDIAFSWSDRFGMRQEMIVKGSQNLWINRDGSTGEFVDYDNGVLSSNLTGPFSCLMTENEYIGPVFPIRGLLFGFTGDNYTTEGPKGTGTISVDMNDWCDYGRIDKDLGTGYTGTESPLEFDISEVLNKKPPTLIKLHNKFYTFGEPLIAKGYNDITPDPTGSLPGFEDKRQGKKIKISVTYPS